MEPAEIQVVDDVALERPQIAHVAAHTDVFVEEPLDEAFAPLYASLFRTAALVVLGLGLSVLASLLLAGRMVKPIRALEAGVAQIGAGALGHRVEVRTGDELETLAEGFNRMTDQVQRSTEDLRRSRERLPEFERQRQRRARSSPMRPIGSVRV